MRVAPPHPLRQIYQFIFHLFQGCSPKLRKLGFIYIYQNNCPWLVCILALNVTKEAIRLGWRGGGGVKKLILWNNDELLEMYYRLFVIMVSTWLNMSDIQSYINSMHNIITLIIRIYLERKKCISSITSFKCITKFQDKKIYLTH